MITRRKENISSNSNILTLKKGPHDIPEDLIDDQIVKIPIDLDKKYDLYDYFKVKNGNIVIKSWAKSFKKKDDDIDLQLLQEILSLILQISGEKIELYKNQIKSDSYYAILDDFRNKMDKNKQIPPLYKFLKSKPDKMSSFWKEVSESLIKSNVFTNGTYKYFIEWVASFNCCKIRVIRQSSTLFICSLFECLINSISWRKNEILKSHQNSEMQLNNQQISLFNHEIEIYTSIANDIYKNLLIIRIRDTDEQIRNVAIKSLTNAIIFYDLEYLNEQKLKYIGRALNDDSPINRKDALNCIKNIYIHQKENNVQYDGIDNHIKQKEIAQSDDKLDMQSHQIKVNNTLQEFSEMYSPRIIEMCNDINEEVVSEAISCLGTLIDCKFIKPEECRNIQKLVSDDSSIIRQAAAKFIAERIFVDSNEDNDDLDHFLAFIQDFGIQKDLPQVISSLYPYLKCLKKWGEMCDRLIAEEDDAKSQIISAVLLHSAKIAKSLVEDNAKGKPKKSQKAINMEKAIKKMRKLALVLIQNLPQLLKAYQSSNDKEIILNLVELSSFLDLNVVSENSCERQYEKLLSQLHEIFIKYGQNDGQYIDIFNSTFNSIFILSKSHSHLSEIAQKELDKLSIIFSDLEVDDDGDDESINGVLVKFVAAAKLVDISSNEKLKNRIVSVLKKYDECLDEQNEDLICNAIECLQCYFKWDICGVHDFLTNGKKADSSESELIEKVETIKNPCFTEFHEFSSLFSDFLRSKKAGLNIKISAFKALGSIISMTPILAYETIDGMNPLTVSAPVVKDEIVKAFYSFYHEVKSVKLKSELFDIAELPFSVKAIDIGYSAHLFVYNYVEIDEDHKNVEDFEYTSDLTEKVKKLWKNLSKYRPINGKQIYSSISRFVENSPYLKSSMLRRITRFFTGKFRVIDYIKEWAEEKDEDEQFLPVVLNFLLGLNESDANQLRGSLSYIFTDALNRISNGVKLTSKDIIKLQVVKKKEPKKKSLKSSQKLEKDESDDIEETSQIGEDKNECSENDSADTEDYKNAKVDFIVNSVDDDGNDDDQIGSSNSFDDEETESSSGDDNDVQEIGANEPFVQESNNESEYSHESEIEFEEPDESFVFRG